MTMLDYTVRDNVAEILINHPPVNALDDALLDQLLALLQRAGADAGVRAIIISSALPGRFCGGLDLASFLDSPHAQARATIERLYTRLCDVQFNLGKPSIAAVGGAARGGGMSLAISCDLIVAADNATFGYPEVDIGLLPAIHYTHLPRIVGRYRAFDLLFTGRTFGAEEAQSLGLVSRVAPAAELLAEARKLAQTLAAKSPELVRMGRAAFMQAIDSNYRSGVAGAVNLLAATIATDDSKEGLTAFVEKRKPVWKKP
ncbi:MAG: enoyl-CoA hydratase/isomerase family protein [Burkholderiales bacterium]|nr:enoyl-CoA hydratase/isomerase family protein [Burkholderiales bacterium]